MTIRTFACVTQVVSDDSWPAALSSDLASGLSEHRIQTQHGTDRLHSSAVSPRSARQGLLLSTGC